MRARVRLQSPVRVDDEVGGAALSWSDGGSAWALVESLSTSLNANYDRQVSTTRVRMTLRARDDVRAGWRLVWGVRTFRILGVECDGGARLSLNCEEEIL